VTTNSRMLQFFMPDPSIATTEVKASIEKDGDDALGRCLESLYPEGRLEWIGTATDDEINAYAAKYGITGKELIAGIFDPVRNADYIRAHKKGEGCVKSESMEAELF